MPKIERELSKLIIKKKLAIQLIIKIKRTKPHILEFRCYKCFNINNNMQVPRYLILGMHFNSCVVSSYFWVKMWDLISTELVL